jgi:Tol biopolymer transport system component
MQNFIMINRNVFSMKIPRIYENLNVITLIGFLLLMSMFSASISIDVEEKIAFMSERDGNYEIYTMNTDGSKQTNITNNPAMDLLPAWSPDGKKIAFVSDRYETNGIYIVDTDGENLVNIAGKSAWFSSFAWSPDGKKIAFVSDRDGNEEIYIVDTDGENLVNVTNNHAHDHMPAWSPDGKKIAFVSDRDGNEEIYVVNTEGSNVQRLTCSHAIDVLPVWCCRSFPQENQPIPIFFIIFTAIILMTGFFIYLKASIQGKAKQ